MKKVYSNKLKESAELYGDAQQVSQFLESEILGASGSLVTAEWDCSDDDKGRVEVTLRLSDWTGAKTARFAAGELKPAEQLRDRLYRLWGDLLQTRNENQLQQLLGTGGEGQ